MNACIMCGAPCVGSACPHCKSGLAEWRTRAGWSARRGHAPARRGAYTANTCHCLPTRAHTSQAASTSLPTSEREYETCVRSARSQYDKARTIRHARPATRPLGGVLGVRGMSPERQDKGVWDMVISLVVPEDSEVTTTSGESARYATFSRTLVTRARTRLPTPALCM